MTALQWLLFIALNEDQERNVGAVEHFAAKEIKLFQVHARIRNCVTSQHSVHFHYFPIVLKEELPDREELI